MTALPWQSIKSAPGDLVVSRRDIDVVASSLAGFGYYPRTGCAADELRPDYSDRMRQRVLRGARPMAGSAL